MTGYGRAQGRVADRDCTVEVRCLNHRYTDVRLSLPRQWLAMEVAVEKRIKDFIGRGRVECSVRFNGGLAETGVAVLDEGRARQAYDVFVQLGKLLEISDKPSLGLVARADGVIVYTPEVDDMQDVKRDLLVLLESALNAAGEMRQREGDRLKRVVLDHLQDLDRLVKSIRVDIPDEQRLMQERTSERIRSMAVDAEVSDERLLQELAILTERADVTEELSRLEIHRKQFSDLLNKAGPVGRELDFLMQEMNREVNTLCSKFRSALVVKHAVSAKAELEKIREQIQNLE